MPTNRMTIDDLPEPYRSQALEQIGCDLGHSRKAGAASDSGAWTGSEESLQQACEKVLRAAGMPYLHVRDSRRCNPGWPDLIILLPAGRLALIELKTATGDQSDEQKEFMGKAIHLGHYYSVARSPEQMVMMIAEAKNMTCCNAT